MRNLIFTVKHAHDRGADERIWNSQKKKKLHGEQKKLHNDQPSLFDFFIRYYSFHQIKEDRVGAASSTHRRQAKRTHFEFENREGKEHWRDQSTEKAK
jgi:hypothetical protein